LALGALVTLTIAGCPFFASLPPNDDAEPALTPFDSAGALLTYFKDQARARTAGNGIARWFGFGGMGTPMAAANDDGDLGGIAEDAGSRSGEPFSTTNIQEAGVDESDVMKSDGTYFYVARDQTLRIVQATPTDELAEVGRLDLDVPVSELYLYESKALLLAQRYAVDEEPTWDRPAIEIWPPYFVASDLVVIEVDVSDPENPSLIKQVEFEGNLVSSRLTNGRLILVLAIAPELPDDPTPVAIGLMTLDDVMPKVQTDAATRDMVSWQDCLHPASPDGYYLTAVVTLDAADVETIVDSVAVMANAGTIYASPEALYVTDADYDPDDNYREKTAVHKFAFDEDGAAQYVASGEVPGRLLNQFSLGEHEGYLRVATHVTNSEFLGSFDDVVAIGVAEAPAAQRSEPPAEFNAVYVLVEVDSALQVVGAVENVAPNEQLHSARFIGERGFLVTFRRIDPLFTLDLADPANPEVKGELEIPGYSDYLHLLDENHLIGVGRSVITMDWGGEEPAAAQLSLFDVSDFESPQLVDQLELGGIHSWSYVTQTHKAFTLMPEQGLLALPLRLTEPGTAYVEYDLDPFYGVVCFDVDPAEGFTELGRLEAVRTSASVYETWYPSSGFWMRAAFIGQTLYAVSGDGVTAAPLADFEDTTVLEFAE
jgi:uncharacterized secreted protein with C-terminal beta-propeller domain